MAGSRICCAGHLLAIGPVHSAPTIHSSLTICSNTFVLQKSSQSDLSNCMQTSPPVPIICITSSRCAVMENFKYAQSHEWVSVDGDIATVGISDFAQVRSPPQHCVARVLLASNLWWLSGFRRAIVTLPALSQRFNLVFKTFSGIYLVCMHPVSWFNTCGINSCEVCSPAHNICSAAALLMQGELGDVVYVELPDEGDKFASGEAFGVVESVKTASDVYAPVSGEIVASNNGATEDPKKACPPLPSS